MDRKNATPADAASTDQRRPLDDAMANCAAEPVHAPCAIQPLGCLFCLDDTLTRICHVSANIETMWGRTVRSALDDTPAALLGSSSVDKLKALKRRPIVFPVTRTVEEQKRSFLLTAYRSGTHVIVEAEPLGRLSERVLATTNRWLARLAEMATEEALLDALVNGVRAITGHDRVMIYVFDEEWNGCVRAESREPEVTSFLGHHFPASDIPPQVRSIYSINPVRYIAEAGAPPVPLQPTCEQALDLSLGTLRAVSPIHAIYLRNMNVQSAMSIAIHDENALWGLLACHDRTTRVLSPALRDAAGTLVQMATQRLFLLRARQRTQFLQRVMDKRPPLHLKRDDDVSGPTALIHTHAPDWLELLDSSGLAVTYGSTIHAAGRHPEHNELRSIADWLHRHHETAGHWNSDFLASTPLAPFASRASCCGLLAVPIPGKNSVAGWLLLLREEHVETRHWAGNPAKTPQVFQGKLMLTPRQSFAAWVQKVRGRSRPWLSSEKQAAEDLAEDLAVAFAINEIDRLNQRLSISNKRLETLAHTDPLTGVWNRYRTELAIDGEIAAAQRYGKPCSILLLDIDHFKRVNDTLGHETGDRVLARLTEALTASLRESDAVGRWGGEEFVVLATHTRLSDAAELAERLRQTVAASDFGNAGPVTISIGVSEYEDQDTRKSLLARADRALYRAKADGRNRVCRQTQDTTT